MFYIETGRGRDCWGRRKVRCIYNTMKRRELSSCQIYSIQTINHYVWDATLWYHRARCSIDSPLVMLDYGKRSVMRADCIYDGVPKVINSHESLCTACNALVSFGHICDLECCLDLVNIFVDIQWDLEACYQQNLNMKIHTDTWDFTKAMWSLHNNRWSLIKYNPKEFDGLTLIS